MKSVNWLPLYLAKTLVMANAKNANSFYLKLKVLHNFLLLYSADGSESCRKAVKRGVVPESNADSLQLWQ